MAKFGPSIALLACAFAAATAHAEGPGDCFYEDFNHRACAFYDTAWTGSYLNIQYVIEYVGDRDDPEHWRAEAVDFQIDNKNSVPIKVCFSARASGPTGVESYFNMTGQEPDYGPCLKADANSISVQHTGLTINTTHSLHPGMVGVEVLAVRAWRSDPDNPGSWIEDQDLKGGAVSRTADTATSAATGAPRGPASGTAPAPGAGMQQVATSHDDAAGQGGGSYGGGETSDTSGSYDGTRGSYDGTGGGSYDGTGGTTAPTGSQTSSGSTTHEESRGPASRRTGGIDFRIAYAAVSPSEAMSFTDTGPVHSLALSEPGLMHGVSFGVEDQFGRHLVVGSELALGGGSVPIKSAQVDGGYGSQSSSAGLFYFGPRLSVGLRVPFGSIALVAGIGLDLMLLRVNATDPGPNQTAAGTNAEAVALPLWMRLDLDLSCGFGLFARGGNSYALSGSLPDYQFLGVGAAFHFDTQGCR
jgi:hypothetical protein